MKSDVYFKGYLDNARNKNTKEIKMREKKVFHTFSRRERERKKCGGYKRDVKHLVVVGARIEFKNLHCIPRLSNLMLCLLL